jgi:hypothetical protein
VEHKHDPAGDGATKSRSTIAFIVFLIIGAILLVTEHRAHLVGWAPYWPWLLILACPLMHLLMHGRHGHGSHGAGDAPGESTKEKK